MRRTTRQNSKQIGRTNKDFRLILDLARSEDAHIPAAEAAFQVNNSVLHTDGDKDFSAVMRYMEMRDEESRVARPLLDPLQRAEH